MNANAKKALQSKPRLLVHVATIFVFWLLTRQTLFTHYFADININSNLLHPSKTLMSIEKLYVIAGNRIYSDVNLDMLC